MSVDLLCVNPEGVSSVWPLASGLIRAAIEQTDLSDFADIEQDVLSGNQLLWLAVSDHIEAAATTHLIKTSGKPVCILTACSGSQMERWLPLLELIETYARNEGASRVRIYGRRGWARVLKSYRTEHIILERSL